MTKKAEALEIKRVRGTKRTCQNSECGARFYDLGRSPIICPVCASPYVFPSTPAPLALEPRKLKRVEYPIAEEPAETAPPDAEAALAEAETEEEAAAEEGEPVLEVEEEEGGDVSTIIGPLDEDEKEP